MAAVRVLVIRLLMPAALLVVGASCSGGGDGSDDSVGATLPMPTEQGDDTSSATEDPTSAGALDTTTAVNPSTMAELEVVWSERRDAIVDRLSGEGFGVTDNVLTGPGDFVVDLNNCPPAWSDGTSETGPIQVVHVLSLADFGPYAAGARAYFDHINSSGGINGRRIDYEVVDDNLVPTKTIEAVDDRIGAGPLSISTFGTPTSQAVFDQLNRECIPQPFVGSGHPAWGDPRSHPWTTGLQLSYATEAIHWGSWIKRNLVGDLPVKVVALTIDNDYGRAYQAAFEHWAASNRDIISEFVVVTHGSDVTDVGSEMAEVGSADPDVFLALTAGAACGSAIDAGETLGLGDTTAARFVPVACTDPERFLTPNDRDGNGYLAVDGGVKAVDDPAFEGDPFLGFINGLLSGAEADSDGDANADADGDADADQVAMAGAGAGQFAWTYVEALRIAVELDGGITRTNFLLALRSLDLLHPMVVSGITFSTDGADDAFPIEGARMMRYSSGRQAWEVESLVVDLNRATPNCGWDGVRCS